MGKRRKPKTRKEKKSRVAKDNIIVKFDGQISSVEQPPTLSSGDLIGSNEDLLLIILIYVVSDKSLFRLKSVSKLWLSVISDPDFSLRWNTKHVPSPSALICKTGYGSDYKFIALDEREKNSFSPNFCFHLPPLSDCSVRYWSDNKIAASCNGLLLLNKTPTLAVFNSTTNQLKLIPKLGKEYFYVTYAYCTFAFDPSKSPHYKVLLLAGPFHNMHSGHVIHIYESEMDLWRVVPSSEDFLFHTITRDDVMLDFGVYWNEAIHWPCREKNSSIYFDLKKECFMNMPMPPIQGNQKKRTIRYFGESGGHLLLIDDEEFFALRFNVFQMEMDHSNWFVKYNVDLISLCWRINGKSMSIHRFNLISLVVSGDRVEGEEDLPILVMYVPKNRMVVSYNLKNEELKDLCQCDFNAASSDFRVWQFIRLATTSYL